MEERFGHTVMKEKYIAEAQLRKKQPGENLREFSQALEDLYRRTCPENPDIVEENAVKTFLDKCGQSEDFRLAVKRIRPKTLQGAVINVMQEECLRVGEKELDKDKPVNKAIYEVSGGRNGMDMINDAKESSRMDFSGRGNGNYGTHYKNHQPSYGRVFRSRPYKRGFGRGRGTYFTHGRDQSEPGGSTAAPVCDCDKKPLN